MGEPIRLYNAEGEVVNVYTRSQAAGMLAGGEWYASEADAEAGKVRPEPTPAVAARLDALDSSAGVVESDVTVDPAPEPAKPKTATRKASATRSKGGL